MFVSLEALVGVGRGIRLFRRQHTLRGRDSVPGERREVHSPTPSVVKGDTFLVPKLSLCSRKLRLVEFLNGSIPARSQQGYRALLASDSTHFQSFSPHGRRIDLLGLKSWVSRCQSWAIRLFRRWAHLREINTGAGRPSSVAVLILGRDPPPDAAECGTGLSGLKSWVSRRSTCSGNLLLGEALGAIHACIESVGMPSASRRRRYSWRGNVISPCTARCSTGLPGLESDASICSSRS